MTAPQITPTLLVTGATGNVGSRTVELLLAAGVRVRAAASSVESVRCRFGDRVEAVALDFTDPATWEHAYSGVHRMFLMRPPHLGKPKTQMLPSLEVAKAAGVEHIVLLSLQGAEHNKVVPHHALEVWLRESGLSWTFVRAAFFMQNLTTTHLTDVRDRNTIMVPAGDGATAFVDVHDVAAIATAALLTPEQHHNTAWTPTGPQALTYAEVAEILTDVLGRPISYPRPGLVRYARHARKVLGMPWGMVAVTSAIYTIARLGRAGGLTDDVLVMTGHDPGSFREFAEREAARWYAT
ncbi:NmrA family NAD(P)-binding protein [Nocardioides zhouii]|uniref:NAD-dependent epimerase/dehydratase family protein n=1 Tax=Nocardioides zhouii TaxID=1168729 RepID=A0A4Q2SZ11_9ACTN|nr:NmrA family NAD(P)-binding protein [Nocardioides zhouii]RYC10913.1 NAD-dependent epimerase/dehydratase family protein [Nocardioides zhouii]